MESQVSAGTSGDLLSPALTAERAEVRINVPGSARGTPSSTGEQTHSVLHWGIHTGFEGTEYFLGVEEER